ncbi:MAG: transcription termination/antitermination NusG family protein [Hyphomicrobium sp.]|jgi:transcription antitermination factor NusG
MSLAEILPPPPRIKRKALRQLHGFDAARAMAAADKGTVDLRMRGEALRWYILRVEPQKEFAAVDIIDKRGALSFVPVEVKFPRQSRHRRRALDKQAEPKKYPIFPGYVFAAFNGVLPMHELAKLYVVKGVVGLEGKPYEVPAKIIDSIKHLSGKALPRRSTPNPHKSFDVGETVEITGGPFEGHVLPIIGVSGKMAEFFVQFLGTEQKVQVPLSFLEAA